MQGVQVVINNKKLLEAVNDLVLRNHRKLSCRICIAQHLWQRIVVFRSCSSIIKISIFPVSWSSHSVFFGFFYTYHVLQASLLFTNMIFVDFMNMQLLLSDDIRRQLFQFLHVFLQKHFPSAEKFTVFQLTTKTKYSDQWQPARYRKYFLVSMSMALLNSWVLVLPINTSFFYYMQ